MLPGIKSSRRVSSRDHDLKPVIRAPFTPQISIKNPFNFPFDTDLITLKEEHLQRLQLQREDENTKPLWQKGMKSKGIETFTQIKNLRENIELPATKAEVEEPDILKAADTLLKNRPRQKETIHDFINRKKEMFLIQMKIDQKKGQIRWFEDKTREKAEKLHIIESRMKEDLDQFKQFVEFNKIQTNEQIKSAENETKEKLVVINKIKSLAEVKTTKLNFNLKLLEKLNNLLSYKQFLDSLTPSSIMDGTKNSDGDRFDEIEIENLIKVPSVSQIREPINSNYRTSKTKPPVNSIMALNDNSKHSQDFKLRKETLQASEQIGTLQNYSYLQDDNVTKVSGQFPKDPAKKMRLLNNKRKFDQDSNGIPHLADSTDTKLMHMIEQLGSKTHNGLIQLIRSSDISFPIYFKNPEELLEMYKEVEEENLKLIRESQKIKTKSEDVEEEITKMKANFEIDQKNLLKNKEELKKKIKDTKINLAKNLTYTSENINEIENAIKTINARVLGLSHLLELKTKLSPLELLKELENKFVHDIEKISELDKDLVKKYSKTIIDEKKQQYMKDLIEFEKQSGINKVNKIRSKNLKRVPGRKDVFRSYFVNKVNEEAEVFEDQNQINENDKYFS